MRGTVYFITLTDEQRAAINRGGWSSIPEGIAYMDATIGGLAGDGRAFARAVELDMYEKAAEVDVESADQVYRLLQNGIPRPAWATQGIKVQRIPGAFARSMMVGDYIEWEDGSLEVCCSLGWERIDGKVQDDAQ